MDSLKLEHIQVTRRFFLRALGASGAATLLPAAASAAVPRGATAIPSFADFEYLTTQEMFGTVERGEPLPYLLSAEKLARAGLTAETWRLDVLSDPKYPATMERELRHHDGTAFRFKDLLELARTRSVRYLKTLTCANGIEPLGMGLWEGVPLRDVLMKTGLTDDCRRVFYQGYHNADPEQTFRSSLPLDRVFEDPIGTPPVILAFKLNGEPISGKRGGPVRIIVPESYGFKNVKWLNLMVLSNRFTANDTYAIYNNTTESWMKTMARFGSSPEKVKPKQRIPISGIAQVGTSGLTRVQYLILPGEPTPDPSDPFFAKQSWKDASILDAPDSWGGGLPEDQSPGGSKELAPAFGFSATTRRPLEWPMPFTLAHWATVAEPLAPGHYTALCRTIDRSGAAQPWPRPLQNSGLNELDSVTFDVIA